MGTASQAVLAWSDKARLGCRVQDSPCMQQGFFRRRIPASKAPCWRHADFPLRLERWTSRGANDSRARVQLKIPACPLKRLLLPKASRTSRTWPRFGTKSVAHSCRVWEDSPPFLKSGWRVLLSLKDDDNIKAHECIGAVGFVVEGRSLLWMQGLRDYVVVAHLWGF